MPKYVNPPAFDGEEPTRTGVLLTNLGTPDAPTSAAVRRYLAEFLWDPRVVEMPRIPWWLILHLVILRIRPRRAATAYKKVWTKKGSPLLVISRKQAVAVSTALQDMMPGPVKVALGMRYGQPSIGSALSELREAGICRLLVLPLYPQYSATTTASTFDAVNKILRTWRWIPEFRCITHYHDNTDYIEALANSVREYWQQQGTPERLLFSFHGLPKRLVELGDPYSRQCNETALRVADRLGLKNDQWLITFQSRFGREEWLTPETSAILRQLAQQGIGHVAVICPGFSADCLETLEEIALQNREIFLHHGGNQFGYIAALNDRPDHIKALAELIRSHAAGWSETAKTE